MKPKTVEKSYLQGTVYLDLLNPFREEIKKDLAKLRLDYCSSEVDIVEYLLLSWGMFESAAPSLAVHVNKNNLFDALGVDSDYYIVLDRPDVNAYGQDIQGVVKQTPWGAFAYLGIFNC
jgi:hypothetical protein